MTQTAPDADANAGLRDLWRLARYLGLRPAYTDNRGRRCRASTETVLAALRACGIEIERPEEAGEILPAQRRLTLCRPLEPITVVWEGMPPQVVIRLPRNLLSQTVDVIAQLESEEAQQSSIDLDAAPVVNSYLVDGSVYVARRITLPWPLACGYHELLIRGNGIAARTQLIVAPSRVYHPAPARAEHEWGAFLPLYALRSERSWAVGDLTDLKDLTDWAVRHGGRIVGTLPLLAQYLEEGIRGEPPDVSPYNPVSRLFFNELYLDVEAVTEFRDAADIRSVTSETAFREQLRALAQGELVDLTGAMAAKRSVLEVMATRFFKNSSSRRVELEHWCADNPHRVRYAAFRAAAEEQGRDWRRWPASVDTRVRRMTALESAEGRPAFHYHLYVQWLLQEQLGELARDVHHRGSRGLYLDLPVGAHPDGYDAWWFRDSLVERVSAGAPPDDFFSKGQSWGFAPIHPLRSRENGHEWIIQSLRAHMQHAAVLRIDHVMWLHRMFWTLPGQSPAAGLYVRSPFVELQAIVCLESHRHECAIVGENLGTVPDVVNRVMDRRGMRPMYVAQFSFATEGPDLLHPPPAGSVAGMNTHDTPPFASFWSGGDIDLRVNLGLLSPEEASSLHEDRAILRRRILRALSLIEQVANDAAAAEVALDALLRELASSEAGIVLVNLEDLWLEPQPQNVPGTNLSSNWRRRARRTLDAIRRDNDIARRVADFDQARRQKETPV